MHGIDMHFAKDDDGTYQKNQIEYWQVIKTMKEWLRLPIRPCDEYITTPNMVIRIPPVVVCARYSKIRFPKVKFPTRHNIWIRDNYTCGYTGVKLAKQELSVDHIIPSSRGGGDTWENLITTSRHLNSCKSNKTPEEAGLKLKFKPTKPKNGLIFEMIRDEWGIFVGDFKT